MSDTTCKPNAVANVPRALGTTLFALILVFASPRAGADGQTEACGTAFSLPPGLAIGDCREFSNEVTTAHCREVTDGQQTIGWFNHLLTVGNHTIGFQCRSQSSDSGFETGDVDAVYSELRLVGGTGQGWKAFDFPLPGLGYFSNPFPCGRHIAFWRLEDTRLSAVVFDTSAKDAISVISAGEILIETDDRYFLPLPEWGADCRSVRFHVDAPISRPFDRTVAVPGSHSP